jgi:uncharacterized integral membrane protein
MSDVTPTPSEPTKSRENWKIAAGAAGVLLLWFCIDNRTSVPVHFWVTTYRAPLIFVIVVAALLGALIVWLWRRARPRLK